MRFEQPTNIAETLGFLSKLGLGVRATNVLHQMELTTAEQFAVLDEQTLLGIRNCGKKTAREILEAVRRYKPSIETAFGKTQALSLFAEMDNMPVTDLRLSVRAMGALERLKITTVGELARLSDRELLDVSNFGRNSLREIRSKLTTLDSWGFVRWPGERQTTGVLSRQITRAARKLRRLRNAATLLSDDYRFGHLVREIGLQVKNAREAADAIVKRNFDPVDARPLMRRLNELIKVMQAGNRMFFELELWNLTEELGSDRDRRIIVSHLGWDGKPPRTLESVGKAYNMTRERVRQICTRIEKTRSSKPFAPVVDRALNVVARAAPTLATEIESQFFQSRLTQSGFCVEALITAARELGREPSFTIETLYGHRVVIPANRSGILARIDQVARSHIRHWGVATVEDVAAAANAPISLAHKLLPILPGFQWLDESCGWFWMENTRRNSLLTQIRKILAASPVIEVGELRTGVGRHHRKKGFAPPRRVLLEMCRQLSWCRVEGEQIMTSTQLNLSAILSNSEQIILKVLKLHGPVIQREKFEHLCLESGMNPHSFWVYLSYCPLICRHATSVYGLRGAEVPVGLVESLAPKQRSRSKLIVDYGWTENRNIQILYRISVAMLTNGVVSIPAAMKAFLQGRFELVTCDNSKIGTFVAKENSGWGLGPFFRRRGGEAGDYLSLKFNLSRRTAIVELSDELADAEAGSPSAIAKGSVPANK